AQTSSRVHHCPRTISFDHDAHRRMSATHAARAPSRRSLLRYYLRSRRASTKCSISNTLDCRRKIPSKNPKKFKARISLVNRRCHGGGRSKNHPNVFRENPCDLILLDGDDSSVRFFALFYLHVESISYDLLISPLAIFDRRLAVHHPGKRQSVVELRVH